MAEAATIARPYAKAAFMSARDSKVLPAWSEALSMASALVADPAAVDLLGNPNVSIDQVVSMFAGFAGVGTDETIDAHWQNFIRLLAQHKRLEVMPQITAQFALLRAQFENELDVQVISAAALSDAQRNKLTEALRTRFKRDVRISASIDPKLLGGAVIRAGDLVIDGSISGRLQRMASELSN